MKKKIRNDPVRCPTCGKTKREIAMGKTGIYDSPNDVYFCSEKCEQNRKDKDDD